MTDLDYQEHMKRYNIFRKMDIVISQYLFNKPCIMWWEVTCDDGCDMISYFNTKHILNELEPLYEFQPGDWGYHENLVEDDDKEKERNWKNGIHRWNLQKIPYYHSDLNLILECEQKLIELNLQGRYIDRLTELFNGNLEGIPGNDLMKFLTLSSEDRTYCIVDVIKEHFNVSE